MEIKKIKRDYFAPLHLWVVGSHVEPGQSSLERQRMSTHLYALWDEGLLSHLWSNLQSADVWQKPAFVAHLCSFVSHFCHGPHSKSSEHMPGREAHL